MAAGRPDRWGRRDGVAAVGLTGGLAAGKSAALEAFRELGAVTISADQVVDDLYREPDVTSVLQDRFGSRVVSPSGELDKGALGEVVRGDPEALSWLEAFIHPRVGRRIQSVIEQASPGQVIVCEIPLLFESGLRQVFDFVVTIEAPLEVRRQRWQERPRAHLFEGLNAQQLSSEERAAKSDLAYSNVGTLEDLRSFVREAYERAQAQAAGELAQAVKDPEPARPEG